MHPISYRHLTRGLLLATIPAMLAVSVMALPAPAVAQVGIEISATVAPPPLIEYEQPPIPAPGYLFTPGYWAYGDAGYYWVPGTWVQPPSVGLLWTPGYWGFVGGRYAFNAGYWGATVGFYGGINYGFGYGGLGYEGGFWRGGQFNYNRTVNNFGGVHITNVYNKQVTVINNTHVAFNGPGGVNRQPTPAEQAAMHENHVQATQEQIQHRTLAAQNPELRASVNHGRPPITATARPGAFPAANREGAEARPGTEARPEAGRPGTVARPGTEPRPEESRAGTVARPGTEPRPVTDRAGTAARPDEARTEAGHETATHAAATHTATHHVTHPTRAATARPATEPHPEASRPEARPEDHAEARPQARPEARPAARAPEQHAAAPRPAAAPHPAAAHPAAKEEKPKM
jgi:hypothetical protein